MTKSNFTFNLNFIISNKRNMFYDVFSKKERSIKDKIYIFFWTYIFYTLH